MTSVAPATLNLTLAAQYVLTCQVDTEADPYSDRAESAYFAALDMWEALTGLTADPALAYAREVADRQTTAILPPF